MGGQLICLGRENKGYGKQRTSLSWKIKYFPFIKRKQRKSIWRKFKYDTYYNKIGWTFALYSPIIINGLRSSIKLSKDCFSKYPDTSNSVKTTRLRLAFFFSDHQHLGVLISWHNPSSCLIYYFILFDNTHKIINKYRYWHTLQTAFASTFH